VHATVSFEKLIAEPQDSGIHVTTGVVDVSTLNDLATQEASDVVFSLATGGHLPRLQVTVDEAPFHRIQLLPTVDGGRLDEGGG